MIGSSKRELLLIQAAGLCMAALLHGCQGGDKAEARSQGRGPKGPPLVAVAQPITPESGQVREYMGTVESQNQVSLVPQIAGQLVKVNASVGDRVARGQILAVVVDPENDARVAQAQATVSVAQGAVQSASASARAAAETVRSRQQAVKQAGAAIAEAEAAIAKARSDLKLAETTLGRTRQLAERQLIAGQELDQAVADEATAQADLDLAQARLRSAESEKKQAQLDVEAAREQQKAALAQVASAQAQVESLAQAARAINVRSDLSNIRSPISGTVVSRSLDPGAYVSAGNQSVIMVIADTKDLRVAFDISEGDLRLVRTGEQVLIRFDAFPDRPEKGIISGLAGGLDTASRTARVEVDLPQASAGVKPGMLGRLSIGADADGMLAVPLPAVISDQGQKFVYVMDANRKVARRRVELASLKGDQALIRQGLTVQDKIVVQGVDLVRDGSTVRLEGDQQ
jgi:RND family efflux transporter MFP subunit